MKTSIRNLPGSVCAPCGFTGAGVASGIKKTGNPDLALIFSSTPCHVAGTFTINQAKAAPVLFDLQRIRGKQVLGIVVNSGNANACTGKEGLENSCRMSLLASQAVTGNPRSNQKDFLVASTGRIGVQLPMARIEKGIQEASRQLSKNDTRVAESIMTTDTFPKQAAVEFQVHGKRVRLGGIAKGAGMIAPHMNSRGTPPALHATMLCFITTDAVISKSLLQSSLEHSVAQSFNRITVDGDMSTNDTVIILANGQAKNPTITAGTQAHKIFQAALNELTLKLALMIVKDGEGISKIVTLHLTGAKSQRDADHAVRSIGESTLVKCSWCGEDPNWGRIVDAIGYSSAKFNPNKVSIAYNNIHLVKNGLQQAKNLQKIKTILKNPKFTITCNLGLGKHHSTLYTTDLTEKYVEFNKGE